MTDAFHSFLHKVEQAIINPLITLLVLAAFVLFLWGIIEFIANAGNDEKRLIGQKHIIWGLIGLVIMFGAKAIIAIAASTFGIPVPAS